MSSTHLSGTERRRRACLAVLVPLLAACFTLDDATGTDEGAASNDRSLQLTAVGASGAMGQIYLTRPPSGAWLINAAVFGPIVEGQSYPMHLHSGTTCDRIGATVITDLGAPVARLSNAAPPAGAYLENTEVARAYLRRGYYFDVHDTGTADGRPIGCAVFPD